MDNLTSFSQHSLIRTRERYGVDITDEDLIKEIYEGRAIHIISDRRTAVFAVLIDHKAIPIVINKKLKRVISVLPRKAMFAMMTKRLYQLRGD